jgi:hypothetical protein
MRYSLSASTFHFLLGLLIGTLLSPTSERPVHGLESILRSENVSPSREGMEQGVLLVEEIIDPEIEREIPGRIIV